ncbi:hypothetical protein V1477_001458 [Vespula maculifrons]|uniref:Uncharacterized protein n=1 Tax=Vespula maculifrons TaxID=7453 RepID=A0ABD2CYW6_VESMC
MPASRIEQLSVWFDKGKTNEKIFFLSTKSDWKYTLKGVSTHFFHLNWHIQARIRALTDGGK